MASMDKIIHKGNNLPSVHIPHKTNEISWMFPRIQAAICFPSATGDQETQPKGRRWYNTKFQLGKKRTICNTLARVIRS